MHYFNEFDPGAAAWLRGLMADGLIPEGEVDERSIAEVQADDLRGFTQCHFFAGIGGWSHALRLAGWPDDRPVWTGSCPCQPFSSAGKRQGSDDERHLWPHFFRLIRECRPDVVFGEQVSSSGVIGRADGRRADGEAAAWLDGIFDDLEGASYTCAAFDLPAAGVGAPHIRQRLYWVAESVGQYQRGHAGIVAGEARPAAEAGHGRGVGNVAKRGGPTSGLADADGRQPRHGGLQPGREHGQQPQDGGFGCGLGDADREREGPVGGVSAGAGVERAGGAGFWDAFDLIPCRDGKLRRVPTRRVERRVQRVADGLPTGLGGVRLPGDDLHPLTAEKIAGRAGLLRGFGNAIVPQVAAEFVRAYLEARCES